MKDLYLIGAGGFSSEVLHLVELIQDTKPVWNSIYFLDENLEPYSKTIRGVILLGGLSCIENIDKQIDVVITINNNNVRKRIVETLKQNSNISFPNLFSPLALIDDKYIELGEGNIVMHYVILSTQLRIGSFNIFNSYAGLGHDCVVGDFNSFGPRVAISGNVTIENFNDFGVNATVLQNKSIGSRNEIWMNTSIMRSIKDDGKYFGIPGKKVQL